MEVLVQTRIKMQVIIDHLLCKEEEIINDTMNKKIFENIREIAENL